MYCHNVRNANAGLASYTDAMSMPREDKADPDP